jgi:hypothetical protein
MIILPFLNKWTGKIVAQNNTWTQKANYGGGSRYSPVAFSIGSKGYFGTGYDGSNPTNDFWEYDPSNNTWSQKANFSGGARYLSVGFSIGSKGYIGTGYNSAYYNDFWEYDPSLNTWSAKATVPGGGRYGAVGFSVGSKGYIGTGYTGSYVSDFYEYDPSNNTWTSKANFAAGGRYVGVGFGIGSKGYLGTGDNGSGTQNDFWEFDPSLNSWTQKANVGGNTRYLAQGFSMATKGYIGLGNGSGFLTDFWEYNPTGNVWTAKANFGGTGRYGAAGFSIGTKGYIGGGYDNSFRNDFWEYSSCQPTVAVSPASAFVCTGSSVTLTASGVNTYTWTGGISNGVSFTPTITSNYTVTGTSTGTCPGTNTAIVTVVVSPTLTNQTVSPATGTIVCAGSRSVVLASSQPGVFYYLRNDANNSLVSNPVAGTGGSIAIGTGNIAITTTFNVNAVAATGGLNFDGVDDYVAINNISNSMGDFTWEAWIKTNTDGTIFSISPPSGAWNWGGKSLFVRNGKISFDSFGIAYTETPGTYNDNNWHHIALTTQSNYSGSLDKVRIYVDGFLAVEKNDWDMNGASEAGYVNKIGYTNSNFPATPAFSGTIDEVRIWTSVRTNAQIAADMTNCLVGNELGLSAYYQFENGTGSSFLTDISAGDNNGALTNMNVANVWVAGHDNCVSCTNQMTNKPIFYIAPIFNQTVTAVLQNICVSGSTTINSSTSETGINYYLRNNATNSIVTGPILGTGSALNFTTGLISSTTVYNVNAKKISGGLSFDGVDDFIAVATTPSVQHLGLAPFTMEAWIYPTNISGVKSIMRKDGDYSLFLINGFLASEICPAGGTGGTYKRTTGTLTMPINQWSHVASVWNGTTAILYVNGVVDNSSILTGISNPLSNLTIGRTTNFSEFFVGKMDEVRIWNTLRTISQLTTNINACLTGTESGLATYYQFENGIGNSTVTDLAGGDNNGILTNMSINNAWTLGVENCGCSAQMPNTPTVNINALPTVSANITSTAVCAGTSITLSGSGASTYTWTGGITNANSFAPTANIVYSVTGTSSVGCISSNTAVSNVTVNAIPIISVNSGSICSGKTFTMVPGGANTYTYSNGSNTATPVSNISYSVTGTSTAGCLSAVAAVANVTVAITPTVSVSSGSICVGSIYTLVPSGAFTYTFSSISATVNPIANTSYSVTGSSSVGCVSSNTAISSLTVNAIPVISVNSGSICFGNTFTLAPNGANTYTFSNGTSTTSPATNSSYSVTGTSSAGCLSSAPAISNVTVVALPIVSVSSGSICSGTTYTMIANGASTYTYSNGTSTVTPIVNTSYSVTGTSSVGCISSNTAVSNVTVNAIPQITVNSGSICLGETFTINPIGANTYTYSNGTNIVTPSITTSYSITGTSAEGCLTNSIAVSDVTVNAIPSLTVNSGAICIGNVFTITPSGANTYTYSNGSNTVSPTITSSYSVTGTSAEGCLSDTIAVSTVTVNNLPIVTAISNNSMICIGEVALLKSNGATTYSWSNGLTNATISITPTVTTTYTVSGIDANGCINTAIVTQSVSECTGVNKIMSESIVFNLYPNPNSGEVTIELSYVSEIIITNALGQVVIKTQLTEGKHVMNLNENAKGIYFIQIKQNTSSKTVKVIKE